MHKPGSTRHPPESTSPGQAARWLAFSVLFVLVAAVAILARNGSLPLIDILYAEDGSLFYSDARAAGLNAIAKPYAGYLNFVPRMASEAIAVLPVSQVAAAYSIVAAVLVAVLALYVFFASRVLLESWLSRALLATGMVLPPLAAETIGNVSNLHWYLMFAAFWAVISNPRNTWWTIVGVSVGAAAALSDPLTALLLPSAALAIYRYRSRRHGFVAAGMVAGLTTQLFVVLGADQVAGAASSWIDLPALYAFRVAGGITIGDVYLTRAWLWAAWLIPVAAITAVTAVVVLAIAWSDGWRRVIVILAVFNSLLFLAASLLIRGTAGFVPIVGEPPPFFATRYNLIPALFIVVCAAVLLDLAVVERTRKTVLAGGMAAAWLVAVIAANFLITPLPGGPRWGAGIEAARLACGSERTEDVEVMIAPSADWKVRLSCTDL